MKNNTSTRLGLSGLKAYDSLSAWQHTLLLPVTEAERSLSRGNHFHFLEFGSIIAPLTIPD
jgi:hypothetical protein